MTPPWLHFFQRTFPSANMVLVEGERPLLVDTGYGSDAPATAALLRAAGMPPERLGLIVNTHYHSDHVGGNYALQSGYGTPIAAHRHDAELVNRRDAAACMAEWLDQPIQPYRVAYPLDDGDTISTGTVELQVIHTPGHTLGQISLYEAETQTLICGDTVHGDDVAWINLFTEGPTALEQAAASVERLAALPMRWACSGHGPPMDNPAAAFAAALRRYEKWRDDQEKLGWHACKRIFAYHLMITGGMAEADIPPYLLTCPWFLAYSRHVFQTEPAAFVQPLIDELVRSKAAGWQNGLLVALAPYTPPPPGWASGPTRPALWP
ncbi:MAG: MBL fold metallo-hydrolase [Chloroflexaceae bacterium]|jgi:glyoxylase-like metal-dependent hydrolase (beta-lactamase superfamily II)|nr:MBL fold metallo-hydrolase [Chloroflexaceae bacterium]